MARKTKVLDGWKKRFDHAVKGPKQTLPLKIELNPAAVDVNKFATLIQVLDIRAADWVEEFIAQHVVDRLDRTYSKANLFAPEMFNAKETGDPTGTHPSDVSENQAGVAALIRRLKETAPKSISGGVASVLGPRVFSLKSSDYVEHPTSKEPPLNTWFFAVEFGTGVAENVGGAWVKGPGEAPGGVSTSGSNIKEADGSWWIGPQRGRGAHMRGRKGVHGFFNRDTRRPHSLWIKVFEEEFPTFINAKMSEILSF